MPLTMNIDSDSVKLALSDSAIKHYKFDYAEADNYAKGSTELVRLNITIDVLEILSLSGSHEANLKTVEDLRDWAKYTYSDKESYKEYYRKVTLKNFFGDEEVRSILLSQAYVNKATESIDIAKGKHTITLELRQKGDMLDYAG